MSILSALLATTSGHITLMIVNALTYEVLYLGKVQIRVWAAILTLPIQSIGLI